MPSKPRLGSIYQRKKRLADGSVIELQTWWVKYSKNGQIFRESSGGDKYADAERLLRKRTAEIFGGAFAGPQADRIKVGELLDDLLLDYQVNGKAYRDFAEPIVRVQLRPVFGSMRATELDTPAVQRYMADRRKQGAANATINRACALLKRAFNLGRMQTPPKVGRVPYIPHLKEDNVRKGFLEYPEFVALRQALPEEIRPVITFAYYTGCRKGEILSLQWTQVDLGARVVRLEAGTTKNDDARLLPLTPELYEVLAMQKAICERRYPDCSWVFSRCGKPILDFRGAWEIACGAAELVDDEGKPTKLFHDLRRTGVRNLIRAGVPERVAMMISGHKSRSVFDRYNIVSERDLQDAARRLGLFIDETKAAHEKHKTESLGTLLGTPAENAAVTAGRQGAKLLN